MIFSLIIVNRVRAQVQRQAVVPFPIIDSNVNKDSFASPLHRKHCLQRLRTQGFVTTLQKLGQMIVVFGEGFVGSVVVSDAVRVQWLK